MNSISFGADKVSFCHKNNCININGDVAKAITVGVAFIVVISSIASLLETTK
jgi:hypothetical protein